MGRVNKRKNSLKPQACVCNYYNLFANYLRFMIYLQITYLWFKICKRFICVLYAAWKLESRKLLDISINYLVLSGICRVYPNISMRYSVVVRKYLTLSMKYQDISMNYPKISMKYADIFRKYSDISIKYPKNMPISVNYLDIPEISGYPWNI